MSAMNASLSVNDPMTEFLRVLREINLRSALAYLLSHTNYRYIAVFRFRDELVESVAYYDRDHPDVEQVDTAIISATYCCYVRDTKGVFTTANAMLDDRTLGHPKRECLAAYCYVLRRAHTRLRR